jgi:hypothetical protein
MNKNMASACVAGAVLGFFAGPGIAFATRAGCMIDIKGGCITGVILGCVLGRLIWKRLHGKKFTIGLAMIFVAGFAMYFAAFASYWGYL